MTRSGADPDPAARRSIATRRGDDAHTDLLFGKRVPKDDPQVEAVGVLDELTALLGWAKSLLPAEARSGLEEIQRDLIGLMGEVACPEEAVERYFASSLARIDAGALARIDLQLGRLEAGRPAASGWALPGSNPSSAAFDVARACARRAERRVAALPRHGRRPRPLLLQYLNRLSDLLWVMAREAEDRNGKA